MTRRGERRRRRQVEDRGDRRRGGDGRPGSAVITATVAVRVRQRDQEGGDDGQQREESTSGPAQPRSLSQCGRASSPMHVGPDANTRRGSGAMRPRRAARSRTSRRSLVLAAAREMREYGRERRTDG